MRRYCFERHELGYAGIKKTVSTKCTLPYCDEQSSKYKGAGSRLCEHHQSLLREYGGPARMDRPWTFNKKKTCEICGHNPWQHPKVKLIEDDLIRDRVAWGMLFVTSLRFCVRGALPVWGVVVGRNCGGSARYFCLRTRCLNAIPRGWHGPQESKQCRVCPFRRISGGSSGQGEAT